MFSKRIVLLLSALAMAATVGCGIKLGEKNKTADENVAKIAGADCLTPSMDSLKKFVNGDATDDEVSASLVCLQDVLGVFKDNVRGHDKNAYTVQEIGRFISDKYLKNSSALSSNLLDEVGKLKVVLVGGAPDEVTKAEVDALRDLIGRYKPAIVSLNPYMKILVQKWQPDGQFDTDNEARLVQAQTVMGQVLAGVTNDLAASGRPYELQDMLSLATEISQQFGVSSATVDLITRAAPLVLKAKLSLIGGNTAVVGNEWNSFGKIIGGLYSQLLRFHYLVTPLRPDDTLRAWKQYSIVASDVSGLMQEVLAGRKSSGGTYLKNSDLAEMAADVTQIMPSLNINGELITQVAKIKLMLVGDSDAGSDGWSANDFSKLKDKAPVICQNLGELLKDFKTLKIDKDALKQNRLNYADFNTAESSAQTAVGNVAGVIDGSYDLADARTLALNLSQTLMKDKLKLPENFDKLMVVAASAKYTLTGESGTGLSNKSIKLLLNVGIRAFANYAEFSNFVSVYTIEEQNYILNFEKLFTKIKTTFTVEMLSKTSHKITTDELTQLVVTAQEQDVLKTALTKESLDTMFNALWANVLNSPEKRINDHKSLDGLNAPALLNLAREVDLWILNQKIISDAFSRKPEYNKQELQALFAKSYKDVQSNYDEKTLAELPQLLAAKGYMNFNSKMYLKILSDTNGLYHVDDLVMSNIARAASRVLIRSFANDLDRVNNLTGISLDEAQYAFNQFKNIIVELNVISASSAETFIASRFREANLFLSVGDGDDSASFAEIHHLILHIVSGLNRAKDLTAVALDRCVKNQTDNLAEKNMDEDCFIDVIYHETAAFEDLPEFLKLREQPEADNKAYYLALLKAAGYVPNDSKTVKLSDASLFPHVVQYLEAIFFTHDANRDRFLEKNEALAAYPVFKNLITILAKPYPTLQPDDMPGVFIYLLKYTKPPKTLPEKLKFGAFVKDHDCSDNKPCMKDWDIQSTRFDLGKIFNFIADATKPTPTPSPTPAPTPAPNPEPQPQPNPQPNP